MFPLQRLWIPVFLCAIVGTTISAADELPSSVLSNSGAAVVGNAADSDSGDAFDADDRQFLPEQPVFDDIETSDAPISFTKDERFGPSLSLDGIFGSRRGIDGNDYSASLAVPWHLDPNRHVLFAMFRGTANDVQGLAASVGVGQRGWFEEIDTVVGTHFWYDFDGSHIEDYQRTGAQLEVLCRQLEIRIGADYVFGVGSTLISPDAGNAQPFFLGHHFALGYYRAETALDQRYFEVGGAVPYLDELGLKAFGGGYRLWADDVDSTVGWQVRASADVTDDVQLGARFTQDDLFGGNLSCQVVLTIPTGGFEQMVDSLGDVLARRSGGESKTAARSRAASVVGRMNARFIHDYRIPVQFTATNEPALVVDAETGEPIVFLHVDANVTATGDGTIERPFDTLEAARLANHGGVRAIRVVPHSGDAGANMVVSAPFQLFAHQRFLSSAVQHAFATSHGLFLLPGYTGGDAPLLTNSTSTPGAVVEIADGVEVSGFTIDGSGRHVGLQGDVRNFDINRNTFQDSTHGVQLANARGFGIIERNTFRNNVDDGVNVTVTSDNALNLVMRGNSASGNGDDAVDITTTGSSLAVTFFENEFGGNFDNGIALTSQMDSTIVAVLQRNRLGEPAAGIAGNGNAGFRIDADSGFADLTVGGANAHDGNVILGNGGEGLSFELTDSAVALVDSRNNIMPAPATGADAFHIEIEFGGGFTASQRALFSSAAVRWQSIIVGDLSHVGEIDDVRILAVAESLDGSGGTYAEAVPTGMRADSLLPFLGTMRFDTADLLSLQVSGNLQDVVLHEMAHVLGFGTLWESRGLLSGSGGGDPRYIGVQATAEYNARFGTSDVGVPLENSGGIGTVDAHWRESIFDKELMSPFINGTVRPISRVTIGQFLDLGYEADLSQADAF